MKPVQFLSNSSQIDNIVKGLTLTKSLFVSSLLYGEAYTGKKTLIQSLFPNSVYVDANNPIELQLALENNSELIIYNFEKLLNFESINFENRRIIAIANHIEHSVKIDKKFAFIYKMPSLKEREDLELLIDFFQDQTQKELMLDYPIQLNRNQLNLSQNIKSLKASLLKQLIYKTINQEDIKELLHNYLSENMEGNNAYREFLGLYEIPLIEAGITKYKSQLKLAQILGLNRNTLRKKIQEHGLD